MDKDLTSVAELVNETLAQSGDSSIEEGFNIESQETTEGRGADVDNTQNPPTQEPPASAKQNDTIESNTAPVAPPITPLRGGDKLAGSSAPPADEQVDPFNQKFKEMFGETDPNEVKARLTEIEKMKQENESLNNLYKDASSKLNQKLDPWATPEIAEFNSFVKETQINDLDFFRKVRESNINELPAREVIALQMKKENPDLNTSEINDYIDGHYQLEKIDYSYLDDPDEIEIKERAQEKAIKRAETNLKIDANKARTDLHALKDKIKPVDLAADVEARQKQAEETVQTLTQGWSPHVSGAIDELRQFPITVPGADGKPEKIATFQVPEDKLTVYNRQAVDFAIANNADPNSVEAKQAINQFIANLIWIDHGDQIVQKSVNAAKASMEQDVNREISNASGDTLPASPSQAQHDPRSRTAEDDELEAFNEATKHLTT